jgi:hypothetical protein
MNTINSTPVNTDQGTRVFNPDVSGVSSDPNRFMELEWKNDGPQVCFAEAIQTGVGSDPYISFAVLKNGANKIVAQSIPGGERLDRGAEFFNRSPQRLGSR